MHIPKPPPHKKDVKAEKKAKKILKNLGKAADKYSKIPDERIDFYNGGIEMLFIVNKILFKK